jgi:hypothetical protein
VLLRISTPSPRRLVHTTTGRFLQAQALLLDLVLGRARGSGGSGRSGTVELLEDRLLRVVVRLLRVEECHVLRRTSGTASSSASPSA